ncbi:MAG: hypothetical protein JXB19_10875 [Bacteroidales bacterium]|nr:hypothetical protein [Bacteroidales bacterium]
MNTRLIFIVIVLFACEFNWAQAPERNDDRSERRRRHILYEQPSIDERIYEDSTGTYVIRFTYGMFDGYTPVDADESSVEVRYSAFIEVFRLENCNQELIGHGFMGTYSPKGCIYDEAEYLISEAQKIELRAERDRNRR